MLESTSTFDHNCNLLEPTLKHFLTLQLIGRKGILALLECDVPIKFEHFKVLRGAVNEDEDLASEAPSRSHIPIDIISLPNQDSASMAESIDIEAELAESEPESEPKPETEATVTNPVSDDDEDNAALTEAEDQIVELSSAQDDSLDQDLSVEEEAEVAARLPSLPAVEDWEWSQ